MVARGGEPRSPSLRHRHSLHNRRAQCSQRRLGRRRQRPVQEAAGGRDSLELRQRPQLVHLSLNLRLGSPCERLEVITPTVPAPQADAKAASYRRATAHRRAYPTAAAPDAAAEAPEAASPKPSEAAAQALPGLSIQVSAPDTSRPGHPPPAKVPPAPAPHPLLGEGVDAPPVHATEKLGPGAPGLVGGRPGGGGVNLCQCGAEKGGQRGLWLLRGWNTREEVSASRHPVVYELGQQRAKLGHAGHGQEEGGEQRGRGVGLVGKEAEQQRAEGLRARGAAPGRADEAGPAAGGALEDAVQGQEGAALQVEAGGELDVVEFVELAEWGRGVVGVGECVRASLCVRVCVRALAFVRGWGLPHHAEHRLEQRLQLGHGHVEILHGRRVEGVNPQRVGPSGRKLHPAAGGLLWARGAGAAAMRRAAGRSGGRAVALRHDGVAAVPPVADEADPAPLGLLGPDLGVLDHA
eukprot:scaffold14306_cov80-Isochrysis_galbana.AAC.7